MEEELFNLNEEEKLKAENDFLKMKIMLEHGGHFYGNEESDMPLPPKIENQFLTNILAFEQEFEKHKPIKVFDRIGRPSHFKPVNEIADTDIEQAWKELKRYMHQYAIGLEACSPSISSRELYRFATEELFEQETDDINLPGWSTNFIYDDFHPDPVYESSRLVEDDLFNDIFRKDELFCETAYANDGFVFNGKYFKDFSVFSGLVNRFKSLFDEVAMKELRISICVVEGTQCKIEGRYRAMAKMRAGEIIFEGGFAVTLVTSELGYWNIKEVQIEGFNP